MPKTRSAVMASVRALIQDEVAEGTVNDFSDEQIQAHLEQALAEVSEKSPCESRETLKTVAGTRDISVASIDGLLGIVKAEYRTGREPPQFRNATLFGAAVTLELDNPPAASGEDVYLYCLKAHTLSETSSTLKPKEERVLIDGTAACTALSWAHNARAQVKLAEMAAAIAETTTASASARIAQAVSDLASLAASASNVSGRINAALADLVLQGATTGAMSALISNAQADLASARANLSGKISLTEAELGNIAARIAQALADLASARGGINTIPMYGAPDASYERTAGGELDAANTCLARARALLSEISAAGHYEAIAEREQANAAIEGGQASLYGAMAERELKAGAAYLSQASAWSGAAARELEAASTCLNQAGASLRSVSSRLSIAQALSIQRWGESKLACYKRELNSLARPRAYRTYPTA